MVAAQATSYRTGIPPRSSFLRGRQRETASPEADRLARELAARTGETLTEAVVVALRERLARETGRTRSIPLREELAVIRRRCAALPVLDTRTADEILGYDERGLPA
jgi:antitoxin VapB